MSKKLKSETKKNPKSLLKPKMRAGVKGRRDRRKIK